MTEVLAAGTQDPPGHTAPCLSAAVIVAVLVHGYLMWREWRGTRSTQNSHGTEETTS